MKKSLFTSLSLFIFLFANCLLNTVYAQTCSQLSIGLGTSNTNPCLNTSTSFWRLGDWQLQNNVKWFVDNVQVGTGSNLNYTFIASGSHVVKIQGSTSDNSCTKSNSLTVNVPSNVGVVSGLTTVNAGQQGVVYSVPSMGSGTYNWYTTTDVQIVSGQGTNSITVNFGNGIGSSFQIVAQHTSTGGCNSTSSLTVQKGTVIDCNSLSLGIGVSTQPPCLGQNTSFWMTGSSALQNDLMWYINNVQVGTGQNLNYTFASAGTYTIKLVGKTAGNTCTKETTTSVTVLPIVGPISGATTVSPNSNQSYTVPNIGVGTYNWWHTTDAQIISGQNTSSATYHFGNSIINSFTVNVGYTSTNGCYSENHLTIAKQDCNAQNLDISASNLNPCLNTSTSFTMTGSNAYLGNIIWKVDGVQVGIGQTLNHTFTIEGVHTLVLIGKNSDNSCEKVVSVDVNVIRVVDAGNDIVTCPKQLVQLIGSVGQLGNCLTSSNITYSWAPAEKLSNSFSLTSLAYVEQTTTFTLTVKEGDQIISSDQVLVTTDQSVCPVEDVIVSDKAYSLKEITHDSVGVVNSSPMYVFDRFGNKYAMEDLAVPSNSVEAGMFRLHFFDWEKSNGGPLDYHTNTNKQMDRQNVITQVFRDLSRLFSPDGSRTNTGLWRPYGGIERPFIEIDIRSNTLPSGSPIPSGAAAGASQFYLDMGNGITYGTVWESINTGFDPYTMLSSTGLEAPNGIFHGIMVVNFNNFVWNTDISTTTFDNNLLDMYSVVLHEAIHLLGVSSMLNENGTSKIQETEGNVITAQRYSLYDTYLKNGNQSLISDVGNCYNYTFNGQNLKGGCGTVNFVGPSVTIPVYSPSQYQEGSSISHFNCDPNASQTSSSYIGNGYAMNHYSGHGSIWVQRTPHPNEILALKDLGYKLTEVYGIGTASVDLGIGSSSGQRCYTTDCMPTSNITVVAGTNDFRPWNYSFSSTDFTAEAGVAYTLNYNAILQNDYNAANISCLEVVYGGTMANVRNQANTGLYDPTLKNTGFTYTPPANYAGTIVFRYRPENIYGVKGNITYIVITVLPGDGLFACAPNNCNLVCQGDFEILAGRTNTVSGFNAFPYNNFILEPNALGTNTYITPDNYVMIETNSLKLDQRRSINEAAVRLIRSTQSTTQQQYTNAVYFPLSKTLDNTKSYVITFQAGIYLIGPGQLVVAGSDIKPFGSFYTPDKIKRVTSTKPDVSTTSLKGSPTINMHYFGEVQVNNFVNQGSDWQTYTITLNSGTFPSGINYFYVYPDNVGSLKADPLNDIFTVLYLDNVELRETNVKPVKISSVVSACSTCTDQVYQITYTIRNENNTSITGPITGSLNKNVNNFSPDNFLIVANSDFDAIGNIINPVLQNGLAANSSVVIKANLSVSGNSINNSKQYVRLDIAANGTTCIEQAKSDGLDLVTIKHLPSDHDTLALSIQADTIKKCSTTPIRVTVTVQNLGTRSMQRTNELSLDLPSDLEIVGPSSYQVSSFHPGSVTYTFSVKPKVSPPEFGASYNIKVVLYSNISKTCAGMSCTNQDTIISTGIVTANPCPVIPECAQDRNITFFSNGTLNDGVPIPAILDKGRKRDTITYTGGGTFNGTYLLNSLLVLKDGTYTFRSGTKFYVASTLDLVPSLEYVYSEVYYNALVSMIQISNSTIEMEQTSFEALCDTMWGGIRVMDSTNLSIKESTIKDAFIGIQHVNNPLGFISNVLIENSLFINNEDAIFVGGYGRSINTISISNNIINNDTVLPLTPRKGKLPQSGIGASSSTLGTLDIKFNKIYNVLGGIGIDAGDEKINVSNNELYNIQSVGIDVLSYGEQATTLSTRSKIKNNKIYLGLPLSDTDYPSGIWVGETSILTTNDITIIDSNTIIGKISDNFTHIQSLAIFLSEASGYYNNHETSFQITDNQFSNNTYGVYMLPWTGLDVFDHPLHMDLRNNTFTDQGIALNFRPAYSVNTLDYNVQCNTFDNAKNVNGARGIQLEDGANVTQLGSANNSSGNKFVNYDNGDKYAIDNKQSGDPFAYFKHSSEAPIRGTVGVVFPPTSNAPNCAGQGYTNGNLRMAETMEEDIIWMQDSLRQQNGKPAQLRKYESEIVKYYQSNDDLMGLESYTSSLVNCNRLAYYDLCQYLMYSYRSKGNGTKAETYKQNMLLPNPDNMYAKSQAMWFDYLNRVSDQTSFFRRQSMTMQDSIDLAYIANSNTPLSAQACMKLRVQYRQYPCNITAMPTPMENIAPNCSVEQNNRMGDEQTSDAKFNGRAWLGNASPNPTKEEAIVSYYIPDNSVENAIKLVDLNTGREMYTTYIDKGEGSVILSTAGLKSGVYSYTLIMNGLPVSTQKLVVLK